MNKQDLGNYATDLATSLAQATGEKRPVRINWRRSRGMIRHDEVQIAGKALQNVYDNGFHGRDTIHKTVPALRGRNPNRLEGVYWLITQTMTSAYVWRTGGKGVAAIARNMARVAGRVPFDGTVEDVPDHVEIEADPEASVAKKWIAQEVRAYQTYMKALVNFLADCYGVSDKMAETVFRNRKGSYHHKVSGGKHQLVFGYASAERAHQRGFNEYKTVAAALPRWFGNGRQCKGLEGMFMLVMHEFAHVLQTEEPEGGITVHYSGRGFPTKRSIHNEIFIEKYRDLLNSLPFRPTLELVDPQTRRILEQA